MSKNLTLKGAAFGALVALGSTLIAGTPAHAAAALTLQPNVGTEYTMIEGEAFTLSAFGNEDFIASNGTALRVKITNATAASFDTFAINGTALDSDNSAIEGSVNTANSIEYTTGAGGRTASSIGTAAGDSAVLGLGASTVEQGGAASLGGASAMTSPFTLSFTNSAVVAGTPEKLDVTVFADTNNDGVQQTTELASATRTVTFIDAADVAPVITAQPWVGDTTFKASVTFGDVNEAQLAAGDVGVLILNNAGTPATPDAGVSGGVYKSGTTPAFTLNTAKTAFEVTVTNKPGGTAVAFATSGTSSAFTLRALFAGAGTPIATDVAGASSYIKSVAVAARSIDATNTTADIVASADSVITTSGSAATARTNKSFVVRLTAKDNAATPAAVAGVATSVTFTTSVTLSATKFLTINGTAYTSATALADLKVSATTDASGQVSVTVVPTGFASGDTVTTAFVAQNSTDSVQTTLADGTYGLYASLGSETANDGYDPSIVAGGSYSTSYVVADEFGTAPADGKYTVSLSRAVSGTARTTAASWTYSVPVVAGVATVNIVDNGAGVGADTVTATLYKVATGGGQGASSGTAQAFVLNYGVSADITPTVLSISDNQDSDDSNIRLDADALPAFNTYAPNGASAPKADASNFKNGATTGASDTLLTISGTVTNAANLGVEGVPVTIAAKGITFKFTDGNSKAIYSRDSIIVPTSAGGTYSVSAFSDAKGGSVVFTATTGTLSKTTTVTFDTGVASAIALTAGSASILPGQTVDVTVKVTDAAGAAVKGIAVTLKSTGVGYLNSQSGTTDADGVVVVKLITGTNDSGTSTISATASLAGVDTTKTATVNVAAVEPSAVVNVVGHRVYVKFNDAKGEEVSAVIGGVRITKTATYSGYVISKLVKAGKVAVKAYVAGDLVKAATVTVK